MLYAVFSDFPQTTRSPLRLIILVNHERTHALQEVTVLDTTGKDSEFTPKHSLRLLCLPRMIISRATYSMVALSHHRLLRFQRVIALLSEKPTAFLQLYSLVKGYSSRGRRLRRSPSPSCTQRRQNREEGLDHRDPGGGQDDVAGCALSSLAQPG